MIKRFLPLLILLIMLIGFFYFRLYDYLSFSALKTHRAFLLQWSESHYFASVMLFMLLYLLAVAVSIPGATLLTLTGGFLFGTALGSVYVTISATLGATLIFLATRYALADWVQRKAGPFVQKMEKGFQQDAFYYLLVLRLVPIFPFWLVNIVPGLLNVRFKQYLIATFLGIIPGTVVYVSLGNGLGAIFDQAQTPNLGIIFKPEVLLPLIGLAILSIIPVIYKKIRGQT